MIVDGAILGVHTKAALIRPMPPADAGD